MAQDPRRQSQTDGTRPPAKLTGPSLREAWQLLGYLRPYRGRLALCFVAMVVSGALSLTFPFISGRLVDAAVAGGTRNLDWLALALAGVFLVQAASSFFHAYGFRLVGESALADLRRATYGRLIRLPMSFHSQRRVGELVSRLASDLTQIQDALVFAVPHFLVQIVVVVCAVSILALTSGRMTLLLLACVPVLATVAVLFGRLIRSSAQAAQDRLADSNVVLEETLQGVATVKAFTSEEYEERRYGHTLGAYLTAALRTAGWHAGFVSLLFFALSGTGVLVLWYGARLVLAGELTAGELTSFLLYVVFVAGALGSFGELLGQMQRAMGATLRVRELLRESPEEVVKPRTSNDSLVGSPGLDDGPPHGEPALLPPCRLRGEILVEDVSFNYPLRPESSVLRRVTLRAGQGQRIALIGPSGSGKSTLVSLLLGFYVPQKGRVLLDGRDVAELNRHELRRQIAVVPQDVLLFGGTIAENIAYGRPEFGDDQIAEAARRANAHEFICSFADGYQTRLGDRGLQLSAGQRQRIAIARALLRDPAVLVLDEATNALDVQSEGLVLQAIDRQLQGRTLIVITHRLSNVQHFDLVYVLRDGQIVASGTYEAIIGRSDHV